MRRDRLERIAMAERDRRAGRGEVAVASLGEATEWPARVVLALAKIPDGEAAEARRILEEGLDLWAEESELDGLDEVLNDPDIEDYVPVLEASASDLERPIDSSELDRVFDEAEAQVEEMHDVNEIAARVLMDESIGLAALAGDDLVPVTQFEEPNGVGDEMLADVFGMDTALVPEPVVAQRASRAFDEGDELEDESHPSRAVILGTLSRWLANIQAGSERRAR
jgi:hypothetical protein